MLDGGHLNENLSTLTVCAERSGKVNRSAQKSLRVEAGVRYAEVFLRCCFSFRAIRLSSCCKHCDSSIPSGMCCRSSRFVFSLLPRCHGLFGSQKRLARPRHLLTQRRDDTRRVFSRLFAGAMRASGKPGHGQVRLNTRHCIAYRPRVARTRSYVRKRKIDADVR